MISDDLRICSVPVKVPQSSTVTSCQSSRVARRKHSSPVTNVVVWLPVISTKDSIALPVSLGGIFLMVISLKINSDTWHYSGLQSNAAKQRNRDTFLQLAEELGLNCLPSTFF